MRFSTKVLITVGVICTLLVFVSDAFAHHGQRGESVAQAAFRDRAAVVKCDKFRYDGHSPSKKWCLAILGAVHTVREPGRKPTRSWVYNRSLLKLARHESSYHPRKVNRTSGACGIGQMLPCDKYGPGSCWPNLRKQAKCFIRYILRRYGTPEAAYAFWGCTGYCGGIYKTNTWY